MKKGKNVKIDFSRKRISSQADKFYNEGKYLSALRFAYKDMQLYGGDVDVYLRLCDIYEGMGLHSSAINWWYRFLDVAAPYDLPDAYEGLAVNYMSIGNEAAAAYYYKRLVDVDDGLPMETKMEIASAFAKKKGEGFRFVYPPQAADFSKEIEAGSKALKMGDCKRAISILSKVEKGSKDYASAMEMQAVAKLLAGDYDGAESICKELLQEEPNDVRVSATLAAVYLEQGRDEESKALALRLYAIEQEDAEELYKVATVCCENGLHEQAYHKFLKLEEKSPYDGRMLYFKAVAAYKCGRYREAEISFENLCTIYPDAEVAKYYLKELRAWLESGKEGAMPAEPTYFYHVPQEEREMRCNAMLHIGNSPKDEAELFGLLALHDGYFRWAFDEMDGTDHELQYLAIVSAEHVRADDFLREVLLDNEVLDVLKIEALRLINERNEEDAFGVVLGNIYRRVFIEKLDVGRKKRKRFVEAHAKVASKFSVLDDTYGARIKRTAEGIYADLEENGRLDLIESADDLACALFLCSGLKEGKGNVEVIASAFEADVKKVEMILQALRQGGTLGRESVENKTKEE